MRDEPLTPEIERELAAIDAALLGEPVEHDLTELGALALALRAERSAPDARFARELDSRAAAGFPKRKRGPRFALPSLRVLAPAGAIAATAVAVVVGLSSVELSGDDSEESAGSGGGSIALAPETAQQVAPTSDDAAELDMDAAGGDESGQQFSRQKKSVKRSGSSSAASTASTAAPVLPAAAGRGSPRSDNRSARRVQRSASLSLAAPPDEISRVADGIIRVTDQLGGFVVTSTVSSTTEGGGGTFELRVPSDRLQQALAQLSRLANVRERQETQQDITASFVSARERLENARSERRGLLRALERADTLGESSAIRARLRDASARIGAAKTDLARVANKASYSTIAVGLSSDAAAPGSGEGGSSWTPGEAAKDALRVLEVAVGVALVGLAVLAPLALLAVLVTVAVRLTARRRRERTLDAV